MKKIIFFLITFFPLAAFCQGGESKISTGLNFSPDYCYRTLKPDSSDKWIADHRDSIEVPKFGYTFGINMMYELSSRFNIEGGIQFSNKGEKTNWIELHPALPDPLVPDKILTVYNYQYLDIPIKLNYFFINGKIKLFISAGISTNIFLAQRTKSVQEFADGSTKISSSVNSMNKFNVVNFAVLAGLGTEYDVSEKIKFRIEPIYRRSLNTIINAPIKGYLYSFGLNLGAYYKI